MIYRRKYSEFDKTVALWTLAFDATKMLAWVPKTQSWILGMVTWQKKEVVPPPLWVEQSPCSIWHLPVHSSDFDDAGKKSAKQTSIMTTCKRLKSRLRYESRMLCHRRDEKIKCKQLVSGIDCCYQVQCDIHQYNCIILFCVIQLYSNVAVAAFATIFISVKKMGTGSGLGVYWLRHSKRPHGGSKPGFATKDFKTSRIWTVIDAMPQSDLQVTWRRAFLICRKVLMVISSCREYTNDSHHGLDESIAGPYSLCGCELVLRHPWRHCEASSCFHERSNEKSSHPPQLFNPSCQT